MADNCFRTGLDIRGRWCKDTVTDSGSLSCCFSCPITDWRYTHGMHSRSIQELANFAADDGQT